MRLSQYPYVVVRIGCTKCSRWGEYRLARLADRYGSEVTMISLLSQLAADCKKRDVKGHVFDFCGASFVDLDNGTRPPDSPRSAPVRLKVVR